MSNKLFEEAIADAKKIREVAEENAKKAVLEAVTPKIREFIESQILDQSENEAKDDEDDDLIKGKKDLEEELLEEVELDESAINTLLNLIGDNDDNSKVAISEAFSRMSKKDQEKLFDITNNLSESTSHINNNKGNDNMSKDKYYEVDLRALREAVENEMSYEGSSSYMKEQEDDLGDVALDNMPEEEDDLLSGMEMEEEAVNSISKDDVEREIQELIRDLGLNIGEGEDEPALEIEPELEIGDEDKEDEDPEMEKLDEVFEVDPAMLRRELKKIRSKLHEGELGLAGESGGIAKDMEHFFGGKGSGNAKKDQFGGKGGSAKGGADFGGGKTGKDVLSEMSSALRNQRRLNSSLETKLGKYRSAVNTLREQLEELNLFNAKLLYVNKLLQNKQISESQKRSVVKALDAAQNLSEAKVLYKSLTESFSEGSKKSRLSENRSIGSSSRTTRSASGNKAATEVDRWAKLAGLKK